MTFPASTSLRRKATGFAPRLAATFTCTFSPVPHSWRDSWSIAHEGARGFKTDVENGEDSCTHTVAAARHRGAGLRLRSHGTRHRRPKRNDSRRNRVFDFP